MGPRKLLTELFLIICSLLLLHSYCQQELWHQPAQLAWFYLLYNHKHLTTYLAYLFSLVTY